jgi:hypothetical protein
MAIIKNEILTFQVNGRMRPRAEELIGLYTILPEDILFMTEQNIVASQDIVDDGTTTSPIPFTNQHWYDYLELISLIVSAANSNPVLISACRSLQVRGIDVILSNLSSTGDTLGLSPTANILRNRIRPRAKIIRARRYLSNDDVRIMGPLLAQYDSQDLIDTGREAEGLLPVPVGYCQAIIQFLGGLIDPSVNTENRAQSIDAACGGNPLSLS